MNAVPLVSWDDIAGVMAGQRWTLAQTAHALQVPERSLAACRDAVEISDPAICTAYANWLFGRVRRHDPVTAFVVALAKAGDAAGLDTPKLRRAIAIAARETNRAA
jgi:hypothetical protein